MKNADIIQQLRQQGWTIAERQGRPFRLPPEVSARHPKLPKSLTAFLAGMSVCVDASESEWFLCEDDFAGGSGSAFPWDAWERLSLKAGIDDDRFTAQVRAFWDAHLPFFLSVRDGYAYFAVRTATDGFGQVVAGREPEFDEPSKVAETFTDFLRLFVNGQART
jgi:hypothetical protein